MSEAIAKQAEQARQQNQAFQKEQYESQVRVTALQLALGLHQNHSNADDDGISVFPTDEEIVGTARAFENYILAAE